MSSSKEAVEKERGKSKKLAVKVRFRKGPVRPGVHFVLHNVMQQGDVVRDTYREAGRCGPNLG